MALTPEDVKRLMPSLEQFLAMKAAEGLDSEEPAHEAAEATSTAPTEGGEGPGMGVVIAMKPKPSPGGGGKVEGCPDCADGTPHEHMK